MIRPRNAAALCALVAIAGCAHGPAVPPQPPPTAAEQQAKRVSSLADRAQVLILAQDAQVWRAWTQGTPLELSQTSAGAADLFTPDAIAAIDAQRRAASGTERVALDHLHAYFVGEYLARVDAEATQSFAELAATISFESKGRPHRLRELEGLLANEESAVKRRRLWADATAAVERLNARVLRREQKVSQALLPLGLTYPAWGEEVREVPLSQAAALAEAILTRTQRGYLSVMERLAHAELQEPFSELRPADLPRLFRPEVVDPSFPAAEVMPRIEDTLKGMGIDLATRKGLTLDTAERPGKNPRGLTLALSPDDVRVSLFPAGGLRAERTALHEIGHALHDSFTRKQRFELTLLGGGATSEGFAQLFEDLAEDPVWLEQEAHLTGSERERFLFANAARKLFLVRREAARLLFSIAHHQDPSADPVALYTPLLSRALGLTVDHDDALRALTDEGELYPQAETLRAWLFSAQLSHTLAERNGDAWWRAPEAGTTLKGLWAEGTARTPEALLQSLGAPGLEPDALLAHLGAALHVNFDAPVP